jgi:hypothetical protein
MQKLSMGILFMSLAVPGLAHAEVQWNGGAGIRHIIRKLDDGLATVDANGKDNSKQTNRRWEYRGMIGASAKGESVDWGIDMRTSGSLTTEWISTQANVNGFGLGFSQAYARWHGNFSETDYGVTIGRAKTVLMYDNVVQNLFDNDVRWDGFGWTFKHGMFGLNATQYVLGAASQGTVGASTKTYNESTDSNAQTQSHFAMLYSVQPYVQFKLTDTITSLLAIGWLDWSGTGGSTTSGMFTNAVHGGQANSLALPTPVAVGNVNPVIMDNPQQWQVLSDTSLPYDLRLVGEYVRNKRTLYGTRTTAASPEVEADRTAWSASLTWGKPKKSGDMLFAYGYGNKGIASVVGALSNGDVAPDNKSHFLEGRYYYADNVNLVLKAQFHTEKSMLDGTGQPLAAPNNNRKTTYQRFEFVTNITI